VRHLGVLKGAGLVTERRDGNRILYSLVEERPASCVGRFLSAVCPEQIVLRHTPGGAFPGGSAVLDCALVMREAPAVWRPLPAMAAS
jgi:DNA-binding transcriptional ArsR family regulator